MYCPFLRKSRICNSGNFCLWNPESSTFYCGIRNPGLWNHEYRSRNPESHLAIGIWNLNSTDKESRTRYLESRIHGVESRNQEWQEDWTWINAWAPVLLQCQGIFFFLRCPSVNSRHTKRAAPIPSLQCLVVYPAMTQEGIGWGNGNQGCH